MKTSAIQSIRKRYTLALAGVLLLIAIPTLAVTPVQVAKLLATDGAAFDQFGLSVAVSGNTAIIGASLDDDNGFGSGSAYVFIRSGTSWSQQAKLTAADGAAFDAFGGSVAVSGNTAIIGARGDDDAGFGSGSAYVFIRSGTSWNQQAKLTAADGATGDVFGFSVAVSDDTTVIGAFLDDDSGFSSGSAYVFIRSGTSWNQQAKLTAADAAAGDVFGIGVAVSGDTAVIGAEFDDDAGNLSGSAYVFIRSGTSWSQQAKLTAADAAAGDVFGGSVAVFGDTAIIGAHLDNDNGVFSGSAYVFARSGANWSQQAKLLASDGSADDRFGIAVTVSSDTAVIGASGDGDNGFFSGSAYVFIRSGTTWSQQAKLTAGDGAAGDRFGDSVAVSDDTAVVGAREDDDNGSTSGSAYVFSFGITVTIDIKPGSDPNAVNPSSQGVIPVAVLGSVDFDATLVDFSTVAFGPGEASPAHGGHVENVNGDGFIDIVFHFNQQETGIQCGDIEATLTGETFDGQSITGTDAINTVNCP